MTGADTELPAPRTLMPPHLVLPNFLPAEDAANFLSFAISARDVLTVGQTRVGADRVPREQIRRSLGTRELGPFAALLRTSLGGRLPELCARVGMASMTPDGIELQLVVHRDGDFYKRHVDAGTVATIDRHRLLTAVYYMHREPKAFSGGSLRLYAIGDPGYRVFTDLEPAHNALVVFPSFAPHEVMPVRCPSTDFADARFSVNCWFYRKRADAQAGGG